MNAEKQLDKSKKIISSYGNEIIRNQSHNANAQVALETKMRALSNAQMDAKIVKNLPDGRIRYYRAEKPATTGGSTRGSSYVTEFDPKIGKVRAWMECYDHAGNVNRVHPKMLNGQNLVGQHFPPIQSELDYWLQQTQGM